MQAMVSVKPNTKLSYQRKKSVLTVATTSPYINEETTLPAVYHSDGERGTVQLLAHTDNLILSFFYRIFTIILLEKFTQK